MFSGDCDTYSMPQSTRDASPSPSPPPAPPSSPANRRRWRGVQTVLGTIALISSFPIFGSLLALFLVFLCYFTGTRPPSIRSISISSIPRRRLRSLTRSFISNVNARRPHLSQPRQLKALKQLKRFQSIN
ncbi:hypothetical protein M378DRAFT_9899 [Amanita muscaria Koide BX008]|uniref:Uncharacterized protein n=1 Tax=Amanita muscaria (strain Koide BX008) TaxID=946122 RepID=A0A0C2XBY1_AMAMK|nr:hypothetical protein M378DRAFT_9899 [Amanita muscaria Koide BX008]